MCETDGARSPSCFDGAGGSNMSETAVFSPSHCAPARLSYAPLSLTAAVQLAVAAHPHHSAVGCARRRTGLVAAHPCARAAARRQSLGPRTHADAGSVAP